MQVTEDQKGTDGAKPAAAAQSDQQTAEQQQLAAGPAAGAVAVEPPEEEKYSVHVPEGLTYFDLDLIKMTAQFVARNGKGFLTGALPSLSLAMLKLVSTSALQGSMIMSINGICAKLFLRLHAKHMTLRLWRLQIKGVLCISFVHWLDVCHAGTAGLAGKEHSNPQFMFLKPTHSMFGFFTSLCDAYSRVLMPDKGLMLKLHQDASDRCVATPM